MSTHTTEGILLLCINDLAWLFGDLVHPPGTHENFAHTFTVVHLKTTFLHVGWIWELLPHSN